MKQVARNKTIKARYGTKNSLKKGDEIQKEQARHNCYGKARKENLGIFYHLHEEPVTI
jgi:hypothetical protein